MSNPLAELRDECRRIMEEAAFEAYPGVDLPDLKFSEPPSPNMGELSSPVCFQLARVLRSRPGNIAENLVRRIDLIPSSLIESAEASAGYVNFHVDVGNFAKVVLGTATKDEGYGFLKIDKPEKVMVEHTSANPIHPITVGTARNSILGACLAEMLKRRGHDVVVHFLVNDMGRQVAMAAFGWRLLGMPEPEGRPDTWVGTVYASVNVLSEIKRLKAEIEAARPSADKGKADEARKQLQRYEEAAKDLRARNAEVFDALAKKIQADPDPEANIVSLNTAYEEGKPEVKEAIRRLVGYCLRGFEETLGGIGISFDSFDYESDLVWRKAADVVLEGLKATPYAFVDKGALILDCDRIAEDFELKRRWGLNPEHEIPRLVLVRSDGTTLYTLRDIAYSQWKFQRTERVINVIGCEQTLAQLQLRIALAALGQVEMGDRQAHYAYEFVRLPDVKMSGRLGRYVTLTEVIDRSVELAYKEVTERSKYLPEEQRAEIARMVGCGAVKYTLLGVDPMKTVVFDWAKALNFETNSAPFIQYSHARACNILKKAGEPPEPEYEGLNDVKERELVMMVAGFPEVFEGAVSELKPGDITAYANSLADKFNSFYASLPVIRAESPGLVGARLNLVDAVRIVLRNALSLLGIDAPERM
jgi:arginyl-tRNA synthetase